MSMTEQKRKAVDGSGPPSKKFKPSNGTKDQKYQKPTPPADKETVLNGKKTTSVRRLLLTSQANPLGKLTSSKKKSNENDKQQNPMQIR